MYDYLLLLIASWMAYRGASGLIIVVVAMLLSLPRFMRDHNARELSPGTAVAAGNALLFSTLAYCVGLGISHLLSA